MNRKSCFNFEFNRVFSKQIRSTLKGQMEEKILADKHDQEMKSHETQMLIEQERQDAERSKQKQLEKTRLLLQVTARNKEVWK